MSGAGKKKCQAVTILGGFSELPEPKKWGLCSLLDDKIIIPRPPNGLILFSILWSIVNNRFILFYIIKTRFKKEIGSKL